MDKRYLLVLDEGTTGLRSIIFDKDIEMVAQSYAKITSLYTGPRDVEQDPIEIRDKQIETMHDVIKKAGISPEEIAAVGIAVQRNTYGFWDMETGKPYYNFIVWQDARGARSFDWFLQQEEFCRDYPDLAAMIPVMHGHILTQLKTLFIERPDVAEAIKSRSAVWGGIDAWLVYNLTGGKVHAASASHMGTLPIYSNEKEDFIWGALKYIDIRPEMMPDVRDDSGSFGVLDKSILGVEIPIYSCMADQQAALFAEGCQQPGTAKCTMGTGAFLDINVGETPRNIPGLVTMCGWKYAGKKVYDSEGMLTTCGTCLEWAKTNLELFKDFDEMGALAASVPDNGGVYFVPAINGMDNAPFFNSTGRGSFMGLSASATKAHLVRAILESLGYAVAYIFETISDIGIKTINLDGGVSRSPIICQVIADVTGANVIRQKADEATAKGAAEMAAIHLGWMEEADAEKLIEIDKFYMPAQDNTKVLDQYAVWKKAVERSKNWL